MSAEQVIVALLIGDAELSALVPARSVYPGTIPQTATLPAIAYTHISSVEFPTVAGDAESVLLSSRIQVTVAAKTYPGKKAVLAAVRRACNRKGGEIAGVRVLHIGREGVGPDFENVDATVFSQSIDFKVQFEELA